MSHVMVKRSIFATFRPDVVSCLLRGSPVAFLGRAEFLAQTVIHTNPARRQRKRITLYCTTVTFISSENPRFLIVLSQLLAGHVKTSSTLVLIYPFYENVKKRGREKASLTDSSSSPKPFAYGIVEQYCTGGSVIQISCDFGEVDTEKNMHPCGCHVQHCQMPFQSLSLFYPVLLDAVISSTFPKHNLT